MGYGANNISASRSEVLQSTFDKSVAWFCSLSPFIEIVFVLLP
jgi:hypothetical protein